MKIQTKGLAPTWFEPITGKQKGKGKSVRLKLKPLSSLEMLEVGDGVRRSGNQIILSAEAVKTLVRLGLAGWENINDERNKPLELDEDSRFLLPHLMLREAAQEIWAISTLSEDERKN